MTLPLVYACRKSVFAAVSLATILYAATPSVADDFSGRRITAGARIFRALLAADVDIVHKRDGHGELRLALLYSDNTGNAQKAAATLMNRDDPRVRQLKIRIETMSLAEFSAEDMGQLAGIFLTQRFNDHQLHIVTAFAKAQHLVVFSPFEGDVERGVQSGIAIEARVRPYLNPPALRAARVRLKPFFWKVAKAHGG